MSLRSWNLSTLIGAILCLTAGPGVGSADSPLTVLPLNAQNTVFLWDNQEYLDLSLAGWGPGWAWQSFEGEVQAEGEVSRASARTTIASSGARVEIAARTTPTGPQQLRFQVRIRSDRDTDLTLLMAGVQLAEPAFARGEVEALFADGSRRSFPLPLGRQGLGESVRSFTLVDGQGRRTTWHLEPALEVTSDRDLRIGLARSLQADVPVEASWTIELPAPLTFYAHPDQVPADPADAAWYPFTPDDDLSMHTEIGMQDWWESPAGKHGRIRARGDRLYYHERPIKLWGLNLCFHGGAAPTHELAERRAALYRKFGINAVRLHKWVDGPGWAGIQTEASAVRFDPEGLDRFDYQNAQFRQAGIFLKLSQAFGTIRVGPDDRQTVPYAEELGAFERPDSRVGGGNSTLFYSTELQDLTIRQLQNILTHRNPYTGLTYAEDPAIAFVEIVNEASILFYTSMNPLRDSPTLRRRTARHFSHWLRERYRDHAGLLAAWGEAALDSFDEVPTPDGQPEHLDRDNLLPLGNPWFWDPERLSGSQEFRRQRLLDSLQFLYTLQVEAYQRIVRGIRETGYEGEIIGSNWHAGRMFSHYANLHSDYQVGTIDRHNYFGGGSRTRIQNASMSRVPGSGMLSTGMEQVADRPFMLSEWIHVSPNEWGVEGPAIIGAYGLGLQGWDVSYLFQNRDDGGFRSQIGRERWDVTAPQVLGIFPAVARQVLRGDVREAELRAVRYVHLPSLFEGQLGFEDAVGSHEYDVRTFDSRQVPAQTLAVARCEVQFTERFRDTPPFDLAAYREGDQYLASTGQLRWRVGQSRHDGHFTIDTPGTKAVVGFADGREANLGEVTIRPECRFAAIYVTARDPDEDIVSGSNLLVVAMARARNTGMRVFADQLILATGESPVVLEPVRATIRLDRPGSPTVHLLDHNGRLTCRTLPVQEGQFEIDGARDQTPYYLIRYD